jgi:hypothetical protein
MAIAVSPNRHHVLPERYPLKSEPPLPWTYGYHATVDSAIANMRIRSRTLKCSPVYKLPFDELEEIRECALLDRERRDALECAAVCTCTTHGVAPG